MREQDTNMGAVTQDVVSKRKPFTVGTRVERQTDGERGTVESVQSFEGVWAVGVRMDSDNEVWSGTQKTAARGAWTRLSGSAPTREEVAAALDELAATSAPTEELGAALSAQESWDAQSVQTTENVAQKSAQGFVCTFPECVVHSK